MATQKTSPKSATKVATKTPAKSVTKVVAKTPAKLAPKKAEKITKAAAAQPAPSDLSEHLGYWVRFVSNQVSFRFENQLKARDVTVAEWVVLRTLFAEATTSHAKLIAHLGMTKGAASKVISKLEEKGLLLKTWGEDNAREQILGLSAAGKRLVPKLSAVADENDKHFFGHLSDADQKKLKSLMKNLVAYHDMIEVDSK